MCLDCTCRAWCTRRASRRICGGGGSCCADKPEPNKHVVGLNWDVVWYAFCTDCLEFGAVCRSSPAAKGTIALHLICRGRVSEDIRPLFDGFSKVGVVKSCITKKTY